MKSSANFNTPYGKVIQRMDLPLEALKQWEYVHPMALVYYLGTISRPFFDVMKTCSTPGIPMKLIIYIDEVCPGNPLRPEKSRTLQAIYWAFVDWPQWMLQRTAAWPVFGTIRSTLVKELAGGVAYLMLRILSVFFSDSGQSMERGLTIVNAKEPLLITAVFAGFLCDEKAHNEVADTKGASGFVHAYCLN